ncbi:MAG: BatA domain-containing protein [Bacteroidales bacterium]|nr:BatA domain-containing protein [Bacteroidales bacterium]
MIFTNPAFLWGLLAVAIPIAVHLFNFRRYRKVYFCNVDRLVELHTESRRRNDLRRWLVLAMRILAIVFLVLAFAQPVLTDGNATMKSGQTVVSIYVDNSFSMESATSDGSQLAAACRKAAEVASSYGMGDRYQLLTADLDGSSQRWLSRDELLDAIDALQPSAASPMLSDVIKRQLDFMRQSGAANRQAYVISDFQRSGCDFDLLSADSNALVTLVPLEGIGADNIYIDTVVLDAPAYFDGGRVNAKVTVRNSGSRDAEKVPVKLYADGRERALATVDIAAGSSASVALHFSIERAGWLDGRVEIDDYPVTFDDSYHFALLAGNAIDIIEIDGTVANENLKKLFGGDTTVRYSTVPRVPVSLADVDFVVLNELKSLSSGEAQQLAAWVDDGGSLLVIPTAESVAQGVSEMLSSVNAPQILRWAKRPSRANGVDYDNALYREVFGGRDEDMELPTVQGHYATGGQSVKQSVIVLADGTDLLSVTPYGQGKVYLFSTPLHAEWTDFVSQALFVPTFYNMALYSRPLPVASHTLGGADPIVLQGMYDLGVKPPELVAPDSSSVIPDIRKVGSRQVLVPHGDMAEAGIYRIADEHLAFNYQRRESVMDFLSRGEVAKAIDGRTGYSMVKNSSKPLGDELRERDGGRRLWRLCLVLALAALAAEVALLKLNRTKTHA